MGIVNIPAAFMDYTEARFSHSGPVIRNERKGDNLLETARLLGAVEISLQVYTLFLYGSLGARSSE
jgi:hypothetical protein